MPLSLQVTKDSISDVQCSTQIYVNQAKFSTNFIGHETKTLINLHLSICDTLRMKFFYGDKKIIIFLPKTPGYKLKEKRQVRVESVIFLPSWLLQSCFVNALVLLYRHHCIRYKQNIL